MKLRVLATAVLLATATTGAYAADLVVDVDPIVEADPVFDWNGFYIGVHGGFGAGASAWDAVAPSVDISVPVSGWLAGLTAGANYQVDNFVLGVEGDVSWSNIGGSIVCPNPAFTCDTNVGWLASLRGRAGYAVDQALLYVTAGLAAGSVLTGTTPDAGFDSTTTHVGFVVGAGVEVAVAENVSVKAEYNFTRLSGTNTVIDPNPVAITTDIHSVKIGANWHF
jgi:outer membrane immunogenic protein